MKFNKRSVFEKCLLAEDNGLEKELKIFYYGNNGNVRLEYNKPICLETYLKNMIIKINMQIYYLVKRCMQK